MPETSSAADAIDAARSAVAADVASVTAALDTAIADLDQQLVSLQERREALEAALAAVNDETASVDTQRGSLVAARDKVTLNGEKPVKRSGGRRGSASAGRKAKQSRKGAAGKSTGKGAAAKQSEKSAAPKAAADKDEYLEFAEAELDPALPRTDRIVTILTRSQHKLSAVDIAAILNEFGDATTAKVVGGTLSNLVKRKAAKKASPGLYTAG